MNAPNQSDGSEPIDDAEMLYRRIPVSQPWYDPALREPVSYQAYRPKEYDTTGLSLMRAKYCSIEEAARGGSPRGYYVGVLNAGELRAAGIEVEPRPVKGNDSQPDQPGHCEIPSLRAETRKSDLAYEQAVILAKRLTRSVEGPFGTE